MANRNGYSSSQIMAMQKDAVRRVNEMQRMARERLTQSTGAVDTPSEPENKQGHASAGEPPRQPNPNNAPPAQPHSPAHTGGHTDTAHSDSGGHRIVPIGPHIGSEDHPHGDIQIHSGGGPQGGLQSAGPLSGLIGPFQGILDRLGLDQESVILLVLLILMVNVGADVSLILALVYILL